MKHTELPALPFTARLSHSSPDPKVGPKKDVANREGDKNVEIDILCPLFHLYRKAPSAPHISPLASVWPLTYSQSPLYFTFVAFITSSINYLYKWLFHVSPPRVWAHQGLYLSCLPLSSDPRAWAMDAT